LIFDGSNPVISGMLWIIPLKQNTPQSPEPTMRQERTVQATLFDIFAEHEIGRELNAMSRWLDQQRSLLSLVAADLSGHGIKETGPSRSTRGSGFALCASQAISTTELRGIGLSFGGLGVVYLVRPPASVVVTKEVGLATDDQRDQHGKLGGDQSRGVEQRTAAEIR
jgi:hypothetical protein